jgi:N-acetylglutamate synthase-like GNAT family acetyltransferase
MKASVRFEGYIKKFGSMGEKTGWTYVEVPAAIAVQLHSNDRRSFRVNGKLDEHAIQSVSLMPMGEGDYILVLNAGMRKAIRKRVGEKLLLVLTKDEKGYQLAKDFVLCIEDEPRAKHFFESLPAGHQRYFSKWIESAKTSHTRDKRIVMAVEALARGWGYPEMIRAAKARKDLL